MEDKKSNIIAIGSITALIILIIVARISLKLSSTFFLILGAGVAAVIAVLTFVVVRYRLDRRRKILETQISSDGRELRIEYSFLRKVAGVPIRFRFKEIEEATGDFKYLIGRGASASVFRGVLADGTAVAVKRIEVNDRGEKEFRSEVGAIASVQHVNLVRLIGYCSIPKLRLIVYEFIPNGSLDKWIFPRSSSNSISSHGGCLSWEVRTRVAIDVAKALSYLHHDCRSRILHLDVKPENILLDQNNHALVSDFGLSKLMGKDESRVITTVRGTKGYLAPEWLLEFGVTEKSDIYSFGMVLLEIIGGRRNVSVIEETSGSSGRKFQYFPKIVSEKLREGRLMEVVDQRLIESGESIDEREVKKLVCVALWCIQEKARLRPSMARVVEMLESRATVDEPPETKMIIVDLLQIDEDPIPGHHRRAAAAAIGRTIQVDSKVPVSSRFSFSMSMISPR
jgi:serine/threonine protein kinase